MPVFDIVAFAAGAAVVFGGVRCRGVRALASGDLDHPIETLRND